MLPRDHDPTPFTSSGLPCLKMDELAIAKAAQRVALGKAGKHDQQFNTGKPAREIGETIEY